LSRREGQPTVDEIVEVTLKECGKQNIVYKMEALQCVTSILHSYEIDRMNDIMEILLPVLPQVGTFHYSAHLLVFYHL